MKPWMKWTTAAVVTMLLVAGIARAVHTRQQQQQAAVAAAALAKPANTIELARGDVVLARTHTLAQGLPISGALKATNSAVVKTRVAGELQGLTVREGDSVQAGQVLAHIAPTEVQARLQQALEQADAAKAQIDIAQRQFANNQALVDQGFISKTALDASQATLNASQSTHRAALAAAAIARQTVADAVLRAPITGVDFAASGPAGRARGLGHTGAGDCGYPPHGAGGLGQRCRRSGRAGRPDGATAH